MIAMYLYPRSRTASAISSIVLRPSVSTVCMWTSPLDVRQFHKFGSVMVGGRFDLSEVLAQFRRDEVEFELGVNLFFALSCHRLLGFKIGQTVFAEREAHLQSTLAQGDIVRFRAGEVLHGRAERFRRQKAERRLACRCDAGN